MREDKDIENQLDQMFRDTTAIRELVKELEHMYYDYIKSETKDLSLLSRQIANLDARMKVIEQNKWK